VTPAVHEDRIHVGFQINPAVRAACESGLHNMARTPDEFVGLPGVFMSVGATAVLGSCGRWTILLRPCYRLWSPTRCTRGGFVLTGMCV